MSVNSFAQKRGDGKTDWSPWTKTCFANLYVSIKCNGYIPDTSNETNNKKNWSWNIRFKNTGNQNSHFSFESWFLQNNEKFMSGRFDLKANTEWDWETQYFSTPPPTLNKNISDFWGFKITRYIENPTDDWTIKSYACNGIYAVCDYNCNESNSQANSNNSSPNNQNTQNSTNTSQNSTGSSGTSSMNRGGNVFTSNSNTQNQNNPHEEIARQQQEKIKLQQEKTNQEVKKANEDIAKAKEKIYEESRQEQITNINEQNKIVNNTIETVNNTITEGTKESNNSKINNQQVLKTTQEKYKIFNLSEKEIKTLLSNSSKNDYVTIFVYNQHKVKNNTSWNVYVNGYKIAALVKGEKTEYRVYQCDNELTVQLISVGGFLQIEKPIITQTIRVKKGKDYHFTIKQKGLNYTFEQIESEPENNKLVNKFKEIKSDIDY